MTQSRNSILYFSYLKKAVIRWFFARDSSLVLPSYQPCLCLMGTVKYRTSDQREEMSKIPEVRGFSACIDSIADAVQELCSYAFSFVYIFGRKSLKPFSPFAKVLSRLRNYFLCVASWTCGTWWIYLLVEGIREEQRQLNHFSEFTMGPYYYQDISWGTCTIKLKRGEEFIMPNVVRTEAMSTIINSTWPLQQFLKLVLCYCLPADDNIKLYG